MIFRWTLFLALLACLVACDQSGVTEPFQVEAGSLTLYGYLDASRNVQRARIEPRRRDVDFPRTPEAAFLDDTEVVSYRVGEDGAPTDSVRWTQRAERLPNGTYAAVFSGFFRPLPLERYRVVTRRAAGNLGPAVEAAEEIVIPAIGPTEVREWRREAGRVVLPITWPLELNARVDTVEALHSGCIINPDSVLAVPDTVSYLADTVVVGGDTAVVAQGQPEVYLGGVPYPIVNDTLFAGQDTIPLVYGPATQLIYTRPVLPDLFAITGPVGVVQTGSGSTVEVDLLAPARALYVGLTDSHSVRYDRLRLGVRVRDAGWTGDGGDPETLASGFLGGANAGSVDLTPPADALVESGLSPGEIGMRCQ